MVHRAQTVGEEERWVLKESPRDVSWAGGFWKLSLVCLADAPTWLCGLEEVGPDACLSPPIPLARRRGYSAGSI